MEGLSRKRATDHLFFSNPTLQEPVFLVYVLLVDSRCSLPDRQHVWCAARVGGIASYGLCFLANMSSRASSTPLAVLDLSYIITTNFSRICRSSSSTVSGYWLSLAKTSDTSVYASQVSHADFFHLPRKADTTSHPVNAWKNRICLVFARPMARQSSCTGIHLMLFP